MPLTFHPKPGTIVICDYSTGFRPPEMVKVRPVVVVSPRRRGSGLVTVVPISSTAPSQIEPWHYRLPDGAYPPARGPVWVKADMIAAVALTRLDRVKVREPGSQRRYQVFHLTSVDMLAISTAIKAALALP
jgi:mRNA interferase MazF